MRWALVMGACEQHPYVPLAEDGSCPWCQAIVAIEDSLGMDMRRACAMARAAFELDRARGRRALESWGDS